MWIQFDELGTAAQYYFGRDYDSSFCLGYDGTDSSNRKLELQVTGTGGHFIRSSDDLGSTLLTASVWSHVAWTWDYNGGSPQFGLYVDGVSKTSSYRVWSDVVSAMSAGTSDLGIGDTPLSATYDFAGKISYVRLFDRALSQAEVQDQVYNPYAYTTNLVGGWDLLTTSPPDISGNGLGGTNSGSATSTDGPPVHLFAGGI
jgi:hypothetical protein